MINNNLDTKKKVLLIIIALSIIIGVVAVGVLKMNNAESSITISDHSQKPEDLLTPETIYKSEEKNPKKSNIFVHITGAVFKPNLYELPEGARVYDAIMLAKPKKNADLDQVNLAEILKDQMKIYVPRKGENINGTNMNSGNNGASVNMSNESSNSSKINLNTANESQLEELDGVGPAIAKRIIEYRQTNGGFHSINDLKNVTGIGDKKFEQIKNQVTI